MNGSLYSVIVSEIFAGLKAMSGHEAQTAVSMLTLQWMGFVSLLCSTMI